MEHIIITNLKNGYKRLVAEEGYQLFNKFTRQFYSEAVVKNVTPYVAVRDEQ